MINKVILVGNLGGDPEVRNLENGSTVASFSLATTESYKKDDEWKNETIWHKVALWNRLAKRAEQVLKKGSKIYLEGKISYRSYEKDGQTKYYTEIIALVVRNLTPKSDSNSTAEPSTAQAENTATNNSSEDDLPF